MMPATAFKVLTAQQWADFERERVFRGAPVDIADGYIHLSTAEQLEATIADLDAYRRAPANQVLRCVECDRILVRTPESGL